MRTLRRIGLVVFLCGVALGYLYQHNRSLRIARKLNDLEIERRLLGEELAGARVDAERLSSFARLESLWVAAGRPCAPSPEPVAVACKPDSLPDVPEREAMPVVVADRERGG